MQDTTELMSSLKWIELAQVEEYLDTPMNEWDNVKSQAKLAMCIYFIMAKRNNPELTMEQAEMMSIQELTDLAGVESPKGQTES